MLIREESFMFENLLLICYFKNDWRENSADKNWKAILDSLKWSEDKDFSSFFITWAENKETFSTIIDSKYRTFRHDKKQIDERIFS
jgi:hypothetical protein